MTTIIDQRARDIARTSLGTSIALSAGAGAGKTSVLVDRVVNLLAAGLEPDRLAAITFTEKASSELQQRVRDELEERLETLRVNNGERWRACWRIPRRSPSPPSTRSVVDCCATTRSNRAGSRPPRSLTSSPGGAAQRRRRAARGGCRHLLSDHKWTGHAVSCFGRET